MSRSRFLDGKVELHCGDSREVLATLETASVDSVVTDPPYGIHFMGKTWDKFGGPASSRGSRERSGAMHAGEYDLTLAGKRQFQEWSEGWAREAFRVLKPGGHLVCFASCRTYHRMAAGIEDAGFEVRDQLAWAFGSGFPKSLDVSKAIDKAAGAEGYASDGASGKGASTINAYGSGLNVNFAPRPTYEPATSAARQWSGYGTALKPAWEPIVLARKPLIGTVAANVLEHGTGAINVDGCRIESEPVRKNTAGGIGYHGGDAIEVGTGTNVHTLGRWPANLLHDGSEEVVALFPDADGFSGGGRRDGLSTSRGSMAGPLGNGGSVNHFGDTGSAARFFYTSKADGSDRLGSKHPTVKPVDLMQWLVRLVTPRGGVCLDPFAGTGTTGEAAWREGCRAILIEREEEYQADIARRLELAQNPTKRAAVAASKNNLDDPNSLPLFGGWPVAAE
jgi:DNA modification methylase